MLKLAILLAAVAVCYVQAANEYYLYTRANSGVPINMTSTDTKLPDEFKPEDNTVILIHGLGGRKTDAFNRLITTDIFMFREQHNVIVVDWENEAKDSYLVAYRYVPDVAKDLSDFLRWLSLTAIGKYPFPATTITSEVVTYMDNVHLVGFGLGAHIAGSASRQLEYWPGLVGRITGLDPSGIGWGRNSARLRNTDAHYVEVIHTDGSGLLSNGIGTAIGDVNFYANSGSNQPGCNNINTCNHNRAYELFAASMRGHLHGSSCSTKIQMKLNLCRGTQLNMGGTELSKIKYDAIYRINTGRSYPF